VNVQECLELVRDRVRQVAPDVEASGLDADVDLRRCADLDSLDFQTLVELIAAATGVEVPERDYPQVRSLRGMAEYVSARAG
jgi:acyl carrier protein